MDKLVENRPVTIGGKVIDRWFIVGLDHNPSYFFRTKEKALSWRASIYRVRLCDHGL